MQMQLTLDLTFISQSKQAPITKYQSWLDVSDIARGVGFIAPVEISIALSDALAPHQAEDDDDYDQRLYDALWLAHHYLSLDQRTSFTFIFDFLRNDKLNGKFVEASLRMMVQAQKNLILIGLPQDFYKDS